MRPPHRHALPYVAIVVASFAFRLPALINAGTTNSDAAVVGLQAMHILRGEWSPFLLGSSYQTSVDSAVAALFFVVLGATPLALMLSSLTGHVALTSFVFGTLRRHVDGWMAAALCLPLVFTGGTVHGNALYPPRQMALTLVFASIWILDGAPLAARPRTRLAIGAATFSLACFADPYATLFAPLVVVFAALVMTETAENKRKFLLSAGTTLLAFAAGAIPLLLLRLHPRSLGGATTLTTSVIDRNAHILVESCLPWALGTKVYAPLHMMDYAPWDPGAAFHAWQVLSAVLLVLAVLFGGAAFFLKRIPFSVRRLGATGFLSLPLTIAAFLVSVMVMDHFSARYLVGFLLMIPFALAPLAWALKTRRFLVVIFPYLLSCAVAGWVGYRPAVDGLRVRTGLTHDDEELGQALRARGIHAAIADYWVSYRLTFLYREEIVVVPSHVSQDRYPPYRRMFEAAPVYAYIVDPLRSEESLESVEARLQERGASVERLRVGALTALIVLRKN